MIRPDMGASLDNRQGANVKNPTPAAAQALVALTAFYPRNRAEARALLATWRHRDRLTAADVRAVLATFKR